MRLIAALILSSSFIPCVHSLTKGQNSETELKVGQPVQRTLDSNKTQKFTLTLEENTFAQLVVEQRGVDVVVHVTSPDGHSLGSFDTPIGPQGLEDVTFLARKAGTYLVSIVPLSEPGNRSDGRYEIKVLNLRAATEQELRSAFDPAANEAKAAALLKEVVAKIEEMGPSPARVRFQISLARLLSSDKKQALQVLDSAAAGLAEVLTSMNEDNDDDEDADYWRKYATATELRSGLVQALSLYDPDKALEFLHSTRTILSTEGQEDSALELLVAQSVATSDPKRALQLAENVLKKDYSTTLFPMLGALRKSAPELADKLGNEIVDKLASEKLIRNSQAAQLATVFLLGDSENEEAALLSEEKRRKLFQKMLSECLNYSSAPDGSDFEDSTAVWGLLEALKGVSPTIDKGVNNAAIEKKYAELDKFLNPPLGGKAMDDGSAEDSFEVTEMIKELDTQTSGPIAVKAVDTSDATTAKQFLSNIERRQMQRNVDQQAALQSLTQGNSEEALRIIRGVKSNRARAQMITVMASQLGSGRNKSVASNILEEARSMVGTSTQSRNQDEMAALLELGASFAKYDHMRTRELLQPVMDQYNELSVAANTLKGFFNQYDNFIGSPVGAVGIGARIPEILGRVAAIDFDTSKVLADRINEPEFRLTIYLAMIEKSMPGSAIPTTHLIRHR